MCSELLALEVSLPDMSLADPVVEFLELDVVRLADPVSNYTQVVAVHLVRLRQEDDLLAGVGGEVSQNIAPVVGIQPRERRVHDDRNLRPRNLRDGCDQGEG